MSDPNRVVYFLIGLPAAGKSTWRESMRTEIGAIVASSDDYIDKMSASEGKTYNQGFVTHAKAAETYVKSLVHHAITNSLPLIWDQTNLASSSRRKRLAMFPTDYIKIAVYFQKPEEDEWRRRLASRPGKTIPEAVLSSMEKSFTMPTLEEGFDDIIIL